MAKDYETVAEQMRIAAEHQNAEEEAKAIAAQAQADPTPLKEADPQ